MIDEHRIFGNTKKNLIVTFGSINLKMGGIPKTHYRIRTTNKYQKQQTPEKLKIHFNCPFNTKKLQKPNPHLRFVEGERSPLYLTRATNTE
jgi:hypothetical protein